MFESDDIQPATKISKENEAPCNLSSKVQVDVSFNKSLNYILKDFIFYVKRYVSSSCFFSITN